MYDGLPDYHTQDDVLRVLANGSREDRVRLPLSLGRKFHDQGFAQKICIRLAETGDQAQQANACLGLAALADRGSHLDHDIVAALLLNAKQTNLNYAWCIDDAMSKINQLMGWHIGSTKPSRQEA